MTCFLTGLTVPGEAVPPVPNPSSTGNSNDPGDSRECIDFARERQRRRRPKVASSSNFFRTPWRKVRRFLGRRVADALVGVQLPEASLTLRPESVGVGRRQVVKLAGDSLDYFESLIQMSGFMGGHQARGESPRWCRRRLRTGPSRQGLPSSRRRSLRALPGWSPPRHRARGPARPPSGRAT